MMSKGMVIFGDIFTVLVIVWLSSNLIGLTPLLKMPFIVIVVGSRIWQHIKYYKQTGKIY
jgi:hypothetical protein